MRGSLFKTASFNECAMRNYLSLSLSLLHLQQPGRDRNSAGQCKHHQVLGPLATLWEAPPTPKLPSPLCMVLQGSYTASPGL